MSTSKLARRHHLRRLAVSLSLLSLASPLLADEIDLNSVTAGIEVESSSSLALSGSNQATATGDLDDDGELDLVVGASGGNGSVHVIFGPLSSLVSPYDLSTDADVDVVGGPTNGSLGHAVAIGDMNNDGAADLIVGAPGVDGPSSRTDSGAVYVFFGPLSAGTLTISSGDADVIIYGDDAGDQLGTTLTVGNLTGTSAVDLGMGAPFGDGSANTISDAGEVIFLNGPLSAGTWDLDSTPGDEIIWGGTVNKHIFKAALGQLNADGDTDLVVSGYGHGTVLVKGMVMVEFGPIATGTDIDLAITTPAWRTASHYTYGNDLLVGDFDGDGQADLLTLATTADAVLDHGVVYGYPGPLASAVDEEAVDEAALQIYFPDFWNNKGGPISLAFGDVTGDSVRDLVMGSVGGSGPADNRVYAGRTDIFFGPIEPTFYDLATVATHMVVHGAANMRLGADVLASDIDDDGNGDLIMLASAESTGVSSTGKIHILTGTDCYYDGFKDGTLDPGWTLSELGSANQGVATETGGYLDLEGDGTGLSGTSDDAVFLYRNNFSGDFRVEATIVDVPSNTGGSFRRGGLWVRSDATPPLGFTADEAPYVSVTYLPLGSGLTSGRLEFRMRQDWGEPGTVTLGSNVSQSGAFTFPIRVAIVRQGSQFCVFYFNNVGGTQQWKNPMGGQDNGCSSAAPGKEGHPVIDSQPQIGLMVGANHTSTTVTYRFDDYAICEP